MNDDSVPSFHEPNGSLHALQLALTFINEALAELDRLQIARGTMDSSDWHAAYDEAWSYFIKSHDSYVSRASALLAGEPTAASRGQQRATERESLALDEPGQP